MVLSTIATLGTIASAIYGGIQSSRQNRNAQRLANEQKARNEQFYDSEIARPVTSRSDYLAMLGRQRDLLNEQYRRARATSMVAGGTDAQTALLSAGANKVLADTTAQYAGTSSNRKDSLRLQKNSMNNTLTDRQIQTYQNAGNQIATSAGQVSKAGAGVMAYDTYTLADDLKALGLRREKTNTTA